MTEPLLKTKDLQARGWNWRQLNKLRARQTYVETDGKSHLFDLTTIESLEAEKDQELIDIIRSDIEAYCVEYPKVRLQIQAIKDMGMESMALPVDVGQGTKQCAWCNVVKHKTEFHKNSKAKDLLQARCKPCCREYSARHYRENHQPKNRKFIAGSLQKHCTRCQMLKATSEFSVNRAVKSGLQSWCRYCVNVRNRERYAKALPVI